MKLLALTVVLLLAIGGAATRILSTTPPVTHVVLIMEENHTEAQALAGMPYLKSLAQQYGYASAMTALHYPSLPNYITLTSGSVPAGIAGKDCTPSASCEDTGASIFSQASWQVWAEAMPKPCDKSNAGLYAPRHTAGPYYTQVAAACPKNDIPLPANPSVSAAFTLVAPDLNDDAHNGSLGQADAWLKTFIPKIEAADTLIEVTFDSGSNNCGANCPSSVLAVFINPAINHAVLAEKTTHCSILRLNEELLGVPLLGCAATAPDLRGGLGL